MILSERDVERQAADLLTRHGWYALKTDAGNVRRGQARAGDLPSGWPDMVFFLLRLLYRLPVQVLRDPEEVHAVIERGRQLRRLIGGKQ